MHNRHCIARPATVLAAFSLAILVLLGAGSRSVAETPTPVPGNASDNAGRGKGDGTGGGRGTGGGGRGGGAQGITTSGPAQLETVKGAITWIEGSSPAGGGQPDDKASRKGARPGPMIRIRTEKDTLSVHAGAPHFRQEQKLDLKVGDVIEITGVRSTRGPSTLIAYTITRGSQVVRLRNDKGDKLWQPRQRAQQPVLTEIKGRVIALDAGATHSPGSGLGRKAQFIVVRTDAEELAVEVGPPGYRQQGGLTLALDDEVSISGWRLPSARTAGKPIMLAASLTKGTTVVKLRDDRRRPLWGKKK